MITADGVEQGFLGQGRGPNGSAMIRGCSESDEMIVAISGRREVQTQTQIIKISLGSEVIVVDEGIGRFRVVWSAQDGDGADVRFHASEERRNVGIFQNAVIFVYAGGMVELDQSRFLKGVEVADEENVVKFAEFAIGDELFVNDVANVEDVYVIPVGDDAELLAVEGNECTWELGVDAVSSGDERVSASAIVE